MAYKKSTRDARATAREARLAKRRRLLDDARANLRDVNDFLDAKYRLAEVDLWLDIRLAEVQAQADRRRTALQQDATKALTGMAARGMQVEEIARMVGVTTETVHKLLTSAT